MHRATTIVGLVFACATGVMLRYERRMKKTGGPGIIAFELAGSSAKATAKVDRWGTNGACAARTSILLDFGYIGPDTEPAARAEPSCRSAARR